jgi:hypothetical protein
MASGPDMSGPWPGIIALPPDISAMTIALLIALAGSLVLMAVIVRRLEQA